MRKLGGLGRGEAQVDGSQFGQLAPGAQSGQGQRGILTGGDDQVQLRRQVLDQEGQRIVHRLCVEDVVVVEDEDDDRSGWSATSLSRAVSVDSGDGGCGDWSTASTPVSDPGRDRLQSRDQVGQEAVGIAVAFDRATAMPPVARSPRPIH